ncbi:MAG: hypothetical protein JJT76_09610 [Clostridiaceae bacterium]|nr:hypothetical protein [Clostridiaceae bacterium]
MLDRNKIKQKINEMEQKQKELESEENQDEQTEAKLIDIDQRIKNLKFLISD